jgi:hypothetical protein
MADSLFDVVLSIVIGSYIADALTNAADLTIAGCTALHRKCKSDRAKREAKRQAKREAKRQAKREARREAKREAKQPEYWQFGGQVIVERQAAVPVV